MLSVTSGRLHTDQCSARTYDLPRHALVSSTAKAVCNETHLGVKYSTADPGHNGLFRAGCAVAATLG